MNNWTNDGFVKIARFLIEISDPYWDFTMNPDNLFSNCLLADIKYALS